MDRERVSDILQTIAPCPFCGSIGHPIVKGETTRVRCGHCGAHGPWMLSGDIGAVMAWNRRHDHEKDQLRGKEFQADLWTMFYDQVMAGNRVEFVRQGDMHNCTIWVPLTVGHRGYSGEALTMAGALETALQALEADPAP